MAAKTYRWSISGLDGNDNAFYTHGTVTCDFPAIVNEALAQSFDQLTNGKAIFGMPGLGCKGPYKIMGFTAHLEVE